MSSQANLNALLKMSPSHSRQASRHLRRYVTLLRLGTPSLAMFRAEKRIRLRERSACSHGIVTIDSPDKPFQPIPGGDAIIVRECDQVAVRSLNPFVARPTDTATVQIL
jgi:hypothetical protein